MRVLGYYPKYRTSAPTPANLPFDRLTHVGYFSKTPNSSGALINTAGVNYDTEMANVVSAVHTAGKKVIFVIGGANGSSDATWRSAVNSTNRATFVSNIASFVTTNGFDGVDIDWEPFSTSSDATDFASFVADLRVALPAPTYTISMFIAIQPSWKLTMANNIQANIDWFGLSTYDFSYGNSITVHDSPLYHSGSQPTGLSADESAQAFISAGVSASKIFIGTLHYVPHWDTGNDLFVSGSYSGNADLYSALAGASSTTPPTGEFNDATAKSSYLKTPFRSYNSAGDVQAKVDYINAQGLGGMIIWELGQAYFSGTSPHFPLMEPFAGELDGGGGGGTLTTIKKINGVLIANVKKINGILIASVKKWNGKA